MLSGFEWLGISLDCSTLMSEDFIGSTSSPKPCCTARITLSKASTASVSGSAMKRKVWPRLQPKAKRRVKLLAETKLPSSTATWISP